MFTAFVMLICCSIVHSSFTSYTAAGTVYYAAILLKAVWKSKYYEQNPVYSYYLRFDGCSLSRYYYLSKVQKNNRFGRWKRAQLLPESVVPFTRSRSTKEPALLPMSVMQQSQSEIMTILIIFEVTRADVGGMACIEEERILSQSAVMESAWRNGFPNIQLKIKP